MYFFELSAFWHLFGYFSSNAIHFLVVNKKIVSYFEKFNGLLFLMIEEFDGSFLIRAFLIERECVYNFNSFQGISHFMSNKTVVFCQRKNAIFHIQLNEYETDPYFL